MVGLRRTAAFLVSFLLMFPLLSETEVHGKIQLNTGYLHMNRFITPDIWFSSSLASLRVEQESSFMKAIVEFSSSLSVNPLSASLFSRSFQLDKAYSKIRIPFINNSFMRFSAGKMPLSWGYGMVYNSGDILFSNTAILSSSNIYTAGEDSMRTFSDWAFHLYVPFKDIAAAEAVFLPPLEFTYVNPQITRTAVRFLFMPYALFIENAEIGASLENNIAQQNISSVKFYGAIDGTLFLDYTLCSSIALSPDNTNSASFNKDFWSISGSLFYTLPKASVRAESLYYPYRELLSLFSMLTVSVSEPLSVQAYYIFSFTNKPLPEQDKDSHVVSAGITWKPAKEFSLALKFDADIKKPDNLTKVSLSGSYSF